MDCPKCNSRVYVKDGIILGKQRYKCKVCRYRYTVLRKSDVKPTETKRLALELYLEGLGFRTIGRILQISYGTVYLWVKEWTLQQSLPRSSVAANMVTLDKIQSYVASKNAATTHGLLLIDLEKNISLLSVKSGLQIKLQSPIIN